MERIQIDIINPKAKNLLLALADLNLIKISESATEDEFLELVQKLREKSSYTPSPEEIAREVNEIRKNRYT